jgi:hypothetical protein
MPNDLMRSGLSQSGGQAFLPAFWYLFLYYPGQTRMSGVLDFDEF